MANIFLCTLVAILVVLLIVSIKCNIRARRKMSRMTENTREILEQISTLIRQKEEFEELVKKLKEEGRL